MVVRKKLRRLLSPVEKLGIVIEIEISLCEVVGRVALRILFEDLFSVNDKFLQVLCLLIGGSQQGDREDVVRDCGKKAVPGRYHIAPLFPALKLVHLRLIGRYHVLAQGRLRAVFQELDDESDLFGWIRLRRRFLKGFVFLGCVFGLLLFWRLLCLPESGFETKHRNNKKTQPGLRRYRECAAHFVISFDA